MANSKVIVFWVRELFYDLKLLPCVFFLLYVMGSEDDHYGTVVREKNGHGETVVSSFSWDVPSLRKGNWSLSQLLNSTHSPFSWATCGIWGAQISLREQEQFPGPSGIAGD